MSYQQRSRSSRATAAAPGEERRPRRGSRGRGKPGPSDLLPLLLWGLLPVLACSWLALRFPAAEVPAVRYVFVALLALAARTLPLVNTRERPITFSGAVVCAGAAAIGPWPAGALAGIAFALAAALPASGRPRLARTLADNAAYVLATMPLAAAFSLLNVVPPLRAIGPGDVPRLLIAAGVYFGSVVAVRALAAARTRRPRAEWRIALGAEAAAFGGFLTLATLPVLLRPGQMLAGGLVIVVGAAAVFLAVRQGVLLRIRQGQVEAITSVSAQALETQSEEALFASLLSSARNLIGFDRAYLWAALPGSMGGDERLHLRVCRPPGTQSGVDATLAWGQGLAGRVAARRRGIVLAGSGDRGANAVLAVPLVSGERRAVGVALFLHAEAGRYGRADLRLIQSVANVVAAAVENVRLHQSIRALAATDGLTGLANRRRLNEILAETNARARRYGRPLAILLCDMDDFKRHNDTFGHLSGDALLKDVAGLLMHGSRAADTVARYGGEEFCIVLPETGRARALLLAERLRAAVAAARFAVGPDGGTVHKTLSFGVAAFPEDAADPEPLLGLADEALYRAKKGGKNRVEAAVKVVSTPGPFRFAPAPRSAPHDEHGR